MKLLGMRPMQLPIKKYLYGMPTKGLPRLTNQLGINGVSLRKSMYQKRLCLWWLTIFLSLPIKCGKYLKTSDRPSVKLRKKQQEAPNTEH